MTAVTLPTTPAPQSIEPRYQTVRTVYRSHLTGKAQANSRPGSYFGIRVTLPPMDYHTWRVWNADLISALESTVIYKWPQPGFSAGSPGAPKVAGSGQSGLELDTDGFALTYQPRKGQFFSVVTASGLNELKVLTSDPFMEAGVGTLAFRPHLRASPADNADIEFVAPKIEGLVVDEAHAWSWDVASAYGVSFTIEDLG